MPCFSCKINVRKNSFQVNENDISSIVKSLNTKNAHGSDNMSIKMIQICGETITGPLKMIFDESLQKEKFPETWKKANIVTIHEKEDKNF